MALKTFKREREERRERKGKEGGKRALNMELERP